MAKSNAVLVAMTDEDILKHVPVPEPLRNLLAGLGNDPQRHPGLMLDRYLKPCPQQEQQRDVLNAVARLPGEQALLGEQLARRTESLKGLAAVTWTRTTSTPLTLHLARSSALENAGICLHPMYGFVYLPGTGLKGMARAYAETVWLPSQPPPDQERANADIRRVFGWVSGSAEKLKDSCAGSVVFHDAWPEKWPSLVVDIVNNHHPEYYQGKGAPGDWDSPNPVYFLAVKPGASFSFALGKRRADVSVETMQLAREWLDAALTRLGCGAKTAAGYGAFSPTGTPLPASPRHAQFTATLELVTPAFLAGASQKREDCELRSATLRGLLRWWWRAMHAGFVTVEQLRWLEAAVWGDTNSGGAVQVRVVPLPGAPTPQPCPFNRINTNGRIEFNPQFRNAHGLQYRHQTTQGLFYAGYGLDQMAGQPPQRRQRWFAAPGSKWQVEVSARPGLFAERDAKGKAVRTVRLDNLELLLDQARAALWWFCSLGGAGAKSRKGFGSFTMPAELSNFEGGAFLGHGKALREACGLPDRWEQDWVQSPSLRLMRRLADSQAFTPWLSVVTPWGDVWKVLDEVGWAMQSFAQAPADTGHGRHCEAKRGLGLPRQIHGPTNQPFPHQNRDFWQPPERLDAACGDRHSSPILFHVSREGKKLAVHVAAFPTADLRPVDRPAAEGLECHQRLLADYLVNTRTYFQQAVSG